MSHTVTLAVLPNSMATYVFGAVEALMIANTVARQTTGSDEPLYRWSLQSLDGKPVKTASGHRIDVDAALDPAEQGSCLLIPALGIADEPAFLKARQRYRNVVEFLRKAADSYDIVAASCGGSFLLAEAGLLDGRNATTSWWMAKIFQHYYPQVHWDTDAFTTLDGPFMLGGGGSAYQTLILAMIERTAGHNIARIVSRYIMVDAQRPSQASYAINLNTSEDRVVRKAESWIQRHIEQDFRIEDVANAVAVSPRTLIRRFKNHLDESPQAFIQRMRVERSKLLLETTRLSFSEIVQRCGYNDESAFRRLFKRLCHVSPGEYRRRFQAVGNRAA